VIFKQVHQHFCRGPLMRGQGPLIACVGPPWVHAQSPSIKVVAICKAVECMRGAPRMQRRVPVKTLRHGSFMQNFSTMSGCNVPNWKNDGLFSCTSPKKECFYSLKCQISSKQHTAPPVSFATGSNPRGHLSMGTEVQRLNHTDKPVLWVQ